jgi:hypothetical protein
LCSELGTIEKVRRDQDGHDDRAHAGRSVGREPRLVVHSDQTVELRAGQGALKRASCETLHEVAHARGRAGSGRIATDQQLDVLDAFRQCLRSVEVLIGEQGGDGLVGHGIEQPLLDALGELARRLPAVAEQVAHSVVVLRVREPAHGRRA